MRIEYDWSNIIYFFTALCWFMLWWFEYGVSWAPPMGFQVTCKLTIWLGEFTSINQLQQWYRLGTVWFWFIALIAIKNCIWCIYICILVYHYYIDPCLEIRSPHVLLQFPADAGHQPYVFFSATSMIDVAKWPASSWMMVSKGSRPHYTVHGDLLNTYILALCHYVSIDILAS